MQLQLQSRYSFGDFVNHDVAAAIAAVDLDLKPLYIVVFSILCVYIW